ncbi:hypothetical protein J7382_08535 [Shimia sp. R11_0]|uniref:hypothetical protein n=1 Tax=Shimia sp. R11_0 TaxID=2821096 RepID=UPI001ADD5345|nr:hypothetical protein [Shimia sp. R11_0]MBO9477576.1 hypothetical protein [Shimia sp. R11_0]
MTKGNGSTKPQPVEINGTTYRSIEQAARKFGLSGTTLANRLNKGLTGNELTKPAVTKATPVEIEGKTYPSVAAAARDFGMCETLLRARLRRGLTGGALLQAPGALQWKRPKPSAPKQEEDEEGQALIAAISDDRYFRAILFPKARKLRLERLAFPFALHGAEVSTHTTPKSFLAEWDRVVGRPSQKIIKLAVTALSAKN